MAYTAVAKPSAHFDTPTWEGSGSTKTISGMGFKPDLLWFKRYDGTGHPVFNDSSKGINFNWIPSGNNANDTNDYVNSYTSDGFTLKGGENLTNVGGQYYTAACWKANGATTTTNDASATGVGSIDSEYQANTTTGVSIVEYTGTGSAGTIAHGLGVAPKIIICKNTAIADRGTTLNMGESFVTDPATDNMQFAANDATLSDQDTKWNDTAPTSTVFSVGSSNMVTGSGQAHIAYCFAEIQGFSKFGYYAGNGAAAKGTFVYCGFRPRYILAKKAGGAENWFAKMIGLTYGLGGELKRTLKYDDNSSSTNNYINITSTGFELATTDGKSNTENGVYFYMAFADHPVVGTNGTIALAV